MKQYLDLYYRSQDGIRLYSRDYPASSPSDALPLICIPGLTRNSSDFGELCSELSENARVLAVDLRGRGRSEYDSNSENYNPLIYAQDILALMQGEGIATARFVGTSLGGLVSMTLAATEPARVAAIVLNDIGPELEAEGIERIKRYVSQPSVVNNWQDAIQLTRRLHHAALEGLSEQEWEAFARQLYREDEQGRPVLNYDPRISDAFNSADPDEKPADLWPLYRTLESVPVLIIRGANSDVISADTVRKMVAINSQARAIEVAGRGHAPFLNEPGVVSAITEFLA